MASKNDDVNVESVIGGTIAGLAPGFSIARAIEKKHINPNIGVGSDKLSIIESDNIIKLKNAMGIKKVDVLKNPSILYNVGPGAYDSDTRKVYLAIKDKVKKSKGLSDVELGILSHELGHSKNFDFFKKKLNKKALNAIDKIKEISVASSLLSSVISAAANASDDKDVRAGGNAIAAISSLPSTLNFLEEAASSARGVKGVAKMYGGGIKGLAKSLYKGIKPHGLSMVSYGSIAAAPIIAGLASSAIRKSRNKKIRENR